MMIMDLEQLNILMFTVNFLYPLRACCNIRLACAPPLTECSWWLLGTPEAEHTNSSQ